MSTQYGVIEGEFFHPARDQQASERWVFWDATLRPAVKIDGVVFDLGEEGMQ